MTMKIEEIVKILESHGFEIEYLESIEDEAYEIAVSCAIEKDFETEETELATITHFLPDGEYDGELTSSDFTGRAIFKICSK
jgi:hypothetical protein